MDRPFLVWAPRRLQMAIEEGEGFGELHACWWIDRRIGRPERIGVVRGAMIPRSDDDALRRIDRLEAVQRAICGSGFHPAGPYQHGNFRGFEGPSQVRVVHL